MRAIKTTRSTLLMLVPAILAIVLVIVLGTRLGRDIRDEVVSRYEQRQLLLTEQTAASIQFILDDAVRDLGYLKEPSGPLCLADLWGMGNEVEVATWREVAGQNLLLYLRSNPIYAQIRYIDASGQEIVGVDNDGETMRSIPQDELRSQAERDFFLTTMALGPGEVYVSPPEPALGHGGVGAGLPTVRLATPISDSQSQWRGIVVLNLPAEEIRTHIVRLSAEEGADAWILDEAGVELVNAAHPELEGSNAYEYCQQTGDENLIALAEDMRVGGKGKAIYLWPGGTGGPPENRVMAYAPVYPAPGHVWSVGASQAYASVVATHSQTQRLLLLMGGAIITVILIGAVLIVQSDHRRVVTEERARRGEELEVLREITLALTAQLKLDELLQNVVERGCRLLGVEVGGVYLADEAKGDLELVASHGYKADYTDVRLAPDEGVIGRVLQSGEPLAVNDYHRWEGRSPHWEGEPLTAVLGVPLKRGEQVAGVMVFAETAQARNFDEHDVWLASLFAGEAAVTIENARLYERAQQEIAERKRAEEALRESEETYRTLTETSPDAVTVTDLEGRITHVSRRTLELSGWENAEELLGKSALDVIAPEDHERAVFNLQRTLTEGTTIGAEYTLLRKDGTRYPAELNAALIRDASGKPKAFIATVRDITGRKRAEEALQEGEERFRRLAENAQDLIYRYEFTPQRRFTYVSPAATLITGYTPEEHYADPDLGFKLVHPDDRPVLESLAGGKIPPKTPVAFRWVRKDGAMIWTEQRNVPVYDEAGNLVALEGIARDITERKRAEEALARSEERYRRLLESVTDYIYTMKIEEGRPVATSHSPSCVAVTGYTPEEYMADPYLWYRMVYDEDKEAVREQAEKMLSMGMAPPLEHRIIHKDGSIRWVRNTPVPRYDDQGRLIAYDGSVSNITERKQAEEALKSRLEQLAALSQASQVVTASLELDQVLAKIVSLTNQVVASDYTGVVLVDEDGNVGQSAENLPEVPALQYRVRPDGLTQWIVQSHQAAIVNKVGEDGVLDLDLGEGAPRRANPVIVEAGIKSFAGLPLLVKDRLLGVLYLHSLHPGAFRDQLPLLTPLANQVAIAIENARLHRGLQDYASRLEQRVQERTAQLQAQYARLDAILRSVSDGIVIADAEGEIVQTNPIAEVWLTRTLSPEDAARLREAVRHLAQEAQERPEMVLELAGLDLELKAAPILEARERETAAVVAVHDVSHLKALDRMKSRFVSDVSHELRTPITTIKLYTELMRRKPGNWKEYLEPLAQEASQQARLVEDILEVSRIDTGRLEIETRPTPLNELTEIVTTNYQVLVQGRQLTLEYRPAEPGLTALVDPGRITQVLSNLVMNAIQYTPEGGTVTVSTGQEVARGRTWATVTVADTGIGVPEQELSHIFERFFRGEKPRLMQVPGTGLGLAIVSELVELHGGQVTVKSQVDVGSTFTIWLPLAE